MYRSPILFFCGLGFTLQQLLKNPHLGIQRGQDQELLKYDLDVDKTSILIQASKALLSSLSIHPIHTFSTENLSLLRMAHPHTHTHIRKYTDK